MKTQKDRKGVLKKIIWIIILILLIAGGALVVKHRKAQLASAPLPERPFMPVTVTEARWGTFPATEKFLGTIRPKIATELSPRISSRILQVEVREGTEVAKGQLLVQLDDREQRDTVSSIQAQLASAKSNMDVQEAIFRRDKRLYEAKAISREALDLSTTRRDAARAQVITLQRQLDSANTILSYTRIRAPFDGIITARLMDPGDLAIPGRAILAMEAPNAGYFIEVKVPQREIPTLRTGDELSLFMDSTDNPNNLPSHRPQPVKTRISRIHPAVRTGTLGIIEADVEQRPFGLPSGAVVNVVITSGEFTGLRVPLRALLELVDSACIFTVSDSTVHIIPVDVAYRGTDWAVVHADSLMGRNLTVITAQESALLRLHQGQKVRIVKSGGEI